MISDDKLVLGSSEHELWKRINKQIENDPISLDMGDWWTSQYQNQKPEEIETCGTAACLAGWASLLSPNTERLSGHWYVRDKITGALMTAPEFAERELGTGGLSFDVFYEGDHTGKLVARFAAEYGYLPLRSGTHAGSICVDSFAVHDAYPDDQDLDECYYCEEIVRRA